MANCNTQQLNITCGTDVVLHDRLIFDGETFDPNLSVGIAANLVSSLGKRTALDVQVVDDELLISVPWIDGTLPGCYGLEVTGSCNSKKWATYADSLIKYTKATRVGVSEVTVESDSYDITQEVAYCYSNSPVTFADVTVDDGYGTPSVDVTYEQRVLNMAFHNLKGNGITDIDVDEQVGDEAVNTVTIKTDADQEGTEFKVRNGRRGNGIASSSEVLSDQDGGTNTFTITDDDGTVHEFHSKNGTKGSQGDSAVYDPSDPDAPDFVMANTTGQSTTKAMTQKAVTDAIEETKQIITGDFVPDFSITNNYYITYKGTIAQSNGYSHTSRIQVKKGDILTYLVGSATSGNAKLSLTDAEGTFYTCIDRTTGTTEKEYEVLNDGYVALSGLTSDGFQVKINRGGLQRQVEEMQHEVADVLEEVKGEDVTPAYTIKSNYYISTAGNDTAHNAYSRSNKIAMLKDDVLDFTATVSSSTVAALALTNEAESSFTPVITGTGSQQRTYKAVADCYVVVSYHIAEGLVLEVRRGGIDILEQRVESIENAITPYDADGMPSHPANPISHLISCPSRARVFSSYGIIGASWDTGYSDGGTPFYDLGYEWPTLFAKTNGVEVHNYALPGHWLNVWLRDRNDSPVFSGSNLPFDSDTFQPDAYLVCMSSNDVNTNNYSAEIGSASDIDPTTDYTQKSYAYNTPFVEVLAEIIQRCKAKSPDCWVFLTTIHKYTPSQSAWVTRRNEMCQAMRDVAPLFDRCDVIDIFQYGMNWDTLANRKKYCSSDSAGSHPSRLGHIYLADQYNTYLDWWVANNAEILRNIQKRLQ